MPLLHIIIGIILNNTKFKQPLIVGNTIEKINTLNK